MTRFTKQEMIDRVNELNRWFGTDRIIYNDGSKTNGNAFTFSYRKETGGEIEISRGWSKRELMEEFNIRGFDRLEKVITKEGR